MKKLIIISGLLMMASFVLAQDSARLMGPAAKNAKPWHKKSEKVKLVYAQSKKKLQGPTAKNAKIWRKANSAPKYAEIKKLNLRTLQGPAAKNFKPWMQPTQEKVNRVAEEGNSDIRNSTQKQ